MIKLDNINVIFNRDTEIQNHVLKDLSLTINNGEFVTVIGGNGAGKSTLMNVISGNIIPFSGDVRIDNINVTKIPEYQRSKYVARVFQDPGTFPELSIEENLSIAYSRGQRRGLRPAIYGNLHNKFRDCLASLNMNLENRIKDKVF